MTARDQLTFVVVGENLIVPPDYSSWAPDRPAFQCRDCGWILPDLCFKPVHRGRASTTRSVRSRCVACDQDRNDAYKRAHRFEFWAKRALGRHMRIERNQRLHSCVNRVEYERVTGIDVDWLARKAETEYNDVDADCSHCGIRWTDMPNGYRDLTLDRVDRKRLLSRSNYQFLCPTGNSQKGVDDERTADLRTALFRERRRLAA